MYKSSVWFHLNKKPLLAADNEEETAKSEQ